MNINNYTIHNLINFQVKNVTGTLKKYFDTTSIQFQNFKSHKELKYDFSVELGPFIPANGMCTIIDDTYHVADGYLYYKDSRKVSKWEVEISNIEKTPKIKIATNFVGNITTPLNIIEFFIQYSLLKKGISVIHSSGISNSEKCVLFPARSGGGKTTAALSLLNDGYLYLGDNFILLDKGIAKNYISPLNIFTYNRLPIIDQSLSTKQRLSMFLKKLIHDITRGHFKVFEKINPVTLLSDSITNNCSVDIICLLEVDSALSTGRVDSESISRDTLIKKLKFNMELDLLSFSKLIYSYGYAFPNSIFSRFWEMYEYALKDNLPKDANIISINVPLKWNENAVKNISKIINQI